MTQAQNDDTWEVEKLPEADDCTYCDDNIQPVFVISDEVMAVIRKLCDDIEVEWQMLLKGHATKTGIYVHGYYIPKQTVTVSTVDNDDDITLEFVKKNDIIATIHSHGSMAVSFSSRDEDCTNNSFIKNHIVTNNNGKYLAVSRVQLPCGMYKFADATVKTDRHNEDVVIEGIENISRKVYTKPVVEYGANLKWGKYGSRAHGFQYNQEDGGFGYGY